MRDIIIQEITKAARLDCDIIFISSDFGAPALDEFRRDLPSQFIQAGIAEQNMIDVAAGLALSGKKVFCYAMAPFLTTRCYEQIKCSLGAMNLPVCLIGVGVGFGYDNTSMTHIAVEDLAVMRAINHLEILTPSDSNIGVVMINEILKKPRLCYLRLERDKKLLDEPLYKSGEAETVFLQGIGGEVRDVTLIASGSMVRVALEAKKILDFLDPSSKFWSDSVGVLDVVRVKPFPWERLRFILNSPDLVVVVEEHVLNGGLGSAVVEALSDAQSQFFTVDTTLVLRLGLKDGFDMVNGDRAHLRKHFGIDAESIAKVVLRMYGEDV